MNSFSTVSRNQNTCSSNQSRIFDLFCGQRNWRRKKFQNVLFRSEGQTATCTPLYPSGIQRQVLHGSAGMMWAKYNIGIELQQQRIYADRYSATRTVISQSVTLLSYLQLSTLHPCAQKALQRNKVLLELIRSYNPKFQMRSEFWSL